MNDFGLSDKARGAITGVLARYPQIDRAVIFGSRAKGTHKPNSDIDLALYARAGGAQPAALDPAMVDEIADALDALPLPYTFDVVDYASIASAPFKAHIDRVGQVFFSTAVSHR